MKSLGIFFALIASLGAQEVKMQAAWEYRQILAVLEIADVADGVDATEARALAEACFSMSEGQCGGLWSMRREGRWWIFETAVGPAGAEGVPIRIHAESGWVSQKGGGKIIRPPWTSLRTWYAGLARARADVVVPSGGEAEKKPENDEPGGAVHPAATPELKPEGNDRPQSEAKVHSQ